MKISPSLSKKDKPAYTVKYIIKHHILKANFFFSILQVHTLTDKQIELANHFPFSEIKEN